MGNNTKVGIGFLSGVIVGMSAQSIYAYVILRRYFKKQLEKDSNGN